MKTLNQRGSSHLVLVIAVLSLVGISAVGYQVMNASDQAPPSVISTKTGEPDSIKSSADLSRASAALEDTSIDGAVNPDQLDSDIEALL